MTRSMKGNSVFVQTEEGTGDPGDFSLVASFIQSPFRFVIKHTKLTIHSKASYGNWICSLCNFGTLMSANNLIAAAICIIVYCANSGFADEIDLFPSDLTLHELLGSCTNSYLGKRSIFAVNAHIDTTDDECSVNINQLVRSKVICSINDAHLLCIRNVISTDFQTRVDVGVIATRDCFVKDVCTIYFDFFDPENNYESNANACGFHIGGVAKLLRSGSVYYIPSIRISQTCIEGQSK
jgi:hypothetical protein